MAATSIARILLAAGPFLAKFTEAKDRPVPEPEGSVTSKARWLQCTIRNSSDFPILIGKTHFDSGRYEDNPGRVNAFEKSQFTCCNGDGTIMTGVSGGQAYKIEIDETHSFHFSIGFTNPWTGTYKAGIVASDDPKKGYGEASQNGGSVESEVYAGKDEDGNEIRFRIYISATASQRPQFVVNETRF